MNKPPMTARYVPHNGLALITPEALGVEHPTVYAQAVEAQARDRASAPARAPITAREPAPQPKTSTATPTHTERSTSMQRPSDIPEAAWSVLLASSKRDGTNLADLVSAYRNLDNAPRASSAPTSLEARKALLLRDNPEMAARFGIRDAAAPAVSYDAATGLQTFHSRIGTQHPRIGPAHLRDIMKGLGS